MSLELIGEGFGLGGWWNFNIKTPICYSRRLLLVPPPALLGDLLLAQLRDLHRVVLLVCVCLSVCVCVCVSVCCVRWVCLLCSFVSVCCVRLNTQFVTCSCLFRMDCPREVWFMPKPELLLVEARGSAGLIIIIISVCIYIYIYMYICIYIYIYIYTCVITLAAQQTPTKQTPVKSNISESKLICIWNGLQLV